MVIVSREKNVVIVDMTASLDGMRNYVMTGAKVNKIWFNVGVRS